MNELESVRGWKEEILLPDHENVLCGKFGAEENFDLYRPSRILALDILKDFPSTNGFVKNR